LHAAEHRAGRRPHQRGLEILQILAGPVEGLGAMADATGGIPAADPAEGDVVDFTIARVVDYEVAALEVA
jgi:hypothetical protein